jgi:hypothetical protein
MKIYISHSIRGKWGNTATKEQMAVNCKRANLFAKGLRKELPDLYVHLPADFEEWVGMAWACEIISEEQILRVDCEIISTCNGMIVFAPDDHISKGMQIEIDWCKSHNIPYLLLNAQTLAIKYQLDISELDIIKDWLESLK